MLQMMNLAVAKVMGFINDFAKKEKGAVDIVAIVILIAVAVVVALIFKDKIKEIVEGLLGQIGEQATAVWEE